VNVEVAKPKSELPKRERREPNSSAPKKRNKRRFGGKKDKAEGDAPRQQETDDGVIVSHADNKKAEDADADKKKKKRKPRKKVATHRDPDAPKPEPRVKRAPTGEPSKTTVFVANLPFSIDDAGLAAALKDYKCKSVKVVLRRGTGRSKGFGFVELEDEAEQAKLLSASPIVVEERELSIKVALSDDRSAADKPAAEASS